MITKSLIEVCTVKTGRRDANHAEEDGKYPFYTCADKPIKSPTYSFEGDLIILPGNGANVGLVLYHSGKIEAYQRTYVLSDFKCEPRYLFHHMNAYWKIANQFQQYGSATNYIRMQNFQDYKIPLPPLGEQRRIAAVLDKADQLRQKRRAALAKLDTVLQATFLHMFGDPVTNPMGWEKRPLEKIGEITTGSTPSRKMSEYYGSFLEWIKSDNINTPHHFLTTAEEYLSELGAKVGRSVPKDSILVTCIAGSPDCIGNAAIANRKVAFNQQINALTPKVSGTTFFLYVQFLVGKRLVQGASTNSMKGMVSKSSFSTVGFLFPPIEMQRDFSKRAEKINNEFGKHVVAAKNLDNLFHSLQQRAFNGRL